jgi:hypothetical protein
VLEEARVREHFLSCQLNSTGKLTSSLASVVTPYASSSTTDTNTMNSQVNILDECSSRSAAATEMDSLDRNRSTRTDNCILDMKTIMDLLRKNNTYFMECVRKIESFEDEYTVRKAKVDELSKQCHDASNQLDEIQQANVSENQAVERLREFIQNEKQISAQVTEKVCSSFYIL